ncbi:MAG: protein kinase [Gammaproteobacteria bacterium]|nr:protein kinase [Gammaproteobacteria bacterium]
MTSHKNALTNGTVLQQYKIESMIAYGGFGIVYKAKHTHLDEAVVIKEYLPSEIATREGMTIHPLSNQEQDDYDEGLARFLDEAKQLIQFKKLPNIVSCRDFFTENGTAYLVMDFEEGLSLSELLRARNNEPLSEKQLLNMMLSLLDGLRFVHEKGVLHRDIKPANIFIRRGDEQPLLIDFGAAKQNYSKHSKSMSPYTVGYVPMEQVSDEGSLGPWTDIYALGAVIWRVISGQNPVNVNKRLTAMIKRKPDPLIPAVEVGAGEYSVGFLQAIDKCLLINEEERFQSVDELVAALTDETSTEEVFYRESLPDGTVLNQYVITETLRNDRLYFVYKAKHTQLDEEVVIEEFYPSTRSQRSEISKAELDEYLFGAKRLTQFKKSPAIISNRDFFTDNGTAYLVMDYSDGMILEKLIIERNNKPFSENQIIGLVQQLLTGLSEVYSKGLFHGHINLRNIYIRKHDERLFLINYLGKAEESFYQKNQGFLNEMAERDPEFDPYQIWGPIYLGSELHLRTDICSIGILMKSLITGDASGDFRKYVDSETNFNGCSESLIKVINKCLQTTQEISYQSVEELLVDLDNLEQTTRQHESLFNNLKNKYDFKKSIVNGSSKIKSVFNVFNTKNHERTKGSGLIKKTGGFVNYILHLPVNLFKKTKGFSYLKLTDGGYGLPITFWLFGVFGSFINFFLYFLSHSPLVIFWFAAYVFVVSRSIWAASNVYQGHIVWRWLVKITTVLGVSLFVLTFSLFILFFDDVLKL